MTTVGHSRDEIVSWTASAGCHSGKWFFAGRMRDRKRRTCESAGGGDNKPLAGLAVAATTGAWLALSDLPAVEVLRLVLSISTGPTTGAQQADARCHFLR